MLSIALHDICLQCFIFELLHFAEHLWLSLIFHRNEQHWFHIVLSFALEKKIAVGSIPSAQK